ncbi:MAG: radical SAM protein [Deltaproteobacteria bacterium]|nr:MAG: radical SAM protein [Deltaproteobacteria bacterium]
MKKLDFANDLRECTLCEHRCGVDRIAGELGVCRMAGPVVASRTLHPAPPESYTIFVAGCNFKCIGCQNWTISQFPDNRMAVEGYVEPRSLAVESIRMLESTAGLLMGADRIFFSGGEPTIHLPFIESFMAEARRIRPALKVNYDTNGFMTEESLRRVLTFTTSLTFDIKAYYEDTMRAITGAPVQPVLRNAEIVGRTAPDKLWEYRIVAIPEINEDDIEPLCRFLASISKELPVAFLAFRPNFVLDEHFGAPSELMNRCVEEANAAGLKNVTYAGMTNIPGKTGSSLEEVEEAYQRSGSRLAASYARSKGCTTHPRDCGNCQSMSNCPIKRYIPFRNC